MLYNYLKIALRHLLRHKAFSFINLFGLAVGITCCLLIFLFIQDELSYDRFHPNANRIYRIHKTNLLDAPFPGTAGGGGFLNAFKNFQSNKMVYLPLPLGPLLQQEVPAVKQALRYKEGEAVISSNTQSFAEEVRYVDKNFFQLFAFKLKQGHKATVLAQPNSLVLTEKMARKYFGNSNPVGRTLRVQADTTKLFTVTGVAAEAPANSSLTYQILLPFENAPMYREFRNELFNYYSVLTFVELREQATVASLQQQLALFVQKKFAKNDADTRTEKKLTSSVRVTELGITSLPDTHFDNTVYWAKVSNPLYTYILGGIAGLILLIAGINYISIALTNAAARTIEIGIRKVMGADRQQLALQLWVEAQLIVFVALIVAVLLANWFLPVFNYFTDKSLVFNWGEQLALLWSMVGLLLVVGLITGGYPALFLSGFPPIQVLKGNRTYRVNPWLSRVLVVVQYSLCLFLVTSALIMYRQMQYISSQELGYDQEQVLVLRNYESDTALTRKLLRQLKQFATENPAIQSVSGASSSFGGAGGITFFYQKDGEDLPIEVYGVDADYLRTLNITLLKGRNFRPESRSDQEEAVIINQTLANRLGDSLVIGEKSRVLSQRVIGVVKDYHFASLETKIAPLLLRFRPDASSYILVKVRAGQIPQAIAGLKKVWQQQAPDQPFDFTFLDDNLAQQYKAYRRWMGIIGAAAAFAIGIACLGLFGLSGLNAVNRTKEIGIRKVLGATIASIFLLLNKDIIRLTLLSFALAVPLAGYIMQWWLQDFAYRITLTWEVFALAGVCGLLTALAAVSFYSLRAAVANPVDALRNE